VAEILVSLFLLIGSIFALIGSLGLARLPDFYMRLHGPTKATTLGVGGMLIASMIHFGARGALSLHELLITLFLFMVAPVSAYLMAKAGMQRGVASRADVPDPAESHPREQRDDQRRALGRPLD
jgi:multicomponent K+:H+ antiporter subunit G